MKKITGLFVSAALLLAVQSASAAGFTNQIKLGGFSSEAAALNASKTAVEQIDNGTRKVALNDSCVTFTSDHPKATDVQIQKSWVNSQSGLSESYKAIVTYQYDCVQR